MQQHSNEWTTGKLAKIGILGIAVPFSLTYYGYRQYRKSLKLFSSIEEALQQIELSYDEDEDFDEKTIIAVLDVQASMG